MTPKQLVISEGGKPGQAGGQFFRTKSCGQWHVHGLEHVYWSSPVTKSASLSLLGQILVVRWLEQNGSKATFHRTHAVYDTGLKPNLKARWLKVASAPGTPTAFITAPSPSHSNQPLHLPHCAQTDLRSLLNAKLPGHQRTWCPFPSFVPAQ